MHTRAQTVFWPALNPMLLAILIATPGCAGRMAHPDQEPQAESVQQQQEAKPAGPSLSMRLDTLEAKMAAMNEKLDATRSSLDNFLAAHEPKASGVPSQASDTVGMGVQPTAVRGESESGFVNDDAVQQYRKGEILLQSGKNPDAITAFTSFLEKYPDHPLAGSAQFHVGEAYFKQGQYLQAEQEFQKVLTSYDRSVHVADTLRLMAQAEDHLGKTQEAARHRQQLTSLFANSPAAAGAVASAIAPVQAPAQPAAPVQVNPPANKGMNGKPGYDEPPPTAPVTNE